MVTAKRGMVEVRWLISCTNPSRVSPSWQAAPRPLLTSRSSSPLELALALETCLTHHLLSNLRVQPLLSLAEWGQKSRAPAVRVDVQHHQILQTGQS